MRGLGSGDGRTEARGAWLFEWIVPTGSVVRGTVGGSEAGPAAAAPEMGRRDRLRWRSEEVLRALKRDGLGLDATQVRGSTSWSGSGLWRWGQHGPSARPSPCAEPGLADVDRGPPGRLERPRHAARSQVVSARLGARRGHARRRPPRARLTSGKALAHAGEGIPRLISKRSSINP